MSVPPDSPPTSSRRAGRPLALIGDDVAENRLELRTIVERADFDVIEACDGEEIVRLARERRPSMILLDVIMPKLDGLDALEEIREEDPNVPVIVMTSSEDPAHGDRALRLGAVNFIRSPFDLAEIEFVIGRIRDAMREEEEHRAAMELVSERRTLCEIDSDPDKIEPMVALLGREIRASFPGHDIKLTEIKLALYEALANAIEHGNLEIGYEGKTRALESEEGLRSLIAARRKEAKYRDRKVYVEAVYRPDRVIYKVTDEGPGFDLSDAEQQRDQAEVTALHGRGLLLIRHYMHSVEWSPEGNQIRMTFKLKPKQ